MVSRQQAAGGCAEAGAKVGVRYFFANCVVFTPAGCGWRLSGRTLIAPHPFPILMSAPQPQPSTSLYNVYHIYSIHISTISTLATTTLYCFYYCLLHSSRILPYIHNLYKCCQCRNHLHFHMITKCVFSVGNNTMPVSSVVDSCRFYTILQSLFYRFAPPRKVQFVNYSRTQNNRATFCCDGRLVVRVCSSVCMS